MSKAAVLTLAVLLALVLAASAPLVRAQPALATDPHVAAMLARVKQANVDVVTPGGRPVARSDGGRAGGRVRYLRVFRRRATERPSGASSGLSAARRVLAPARLRTTRRLRYQLFLA